MRWTYLLLLCLCTSVAEAYGPEDRSLDDKENGISLHAPVGWVLHRQPGYPSQLAIWVSSDGQASIVLALGHLLPGQSLGGFVDSNCSAMRAAGLTVQTCARKDTLRPEWRLVEAQERQDGALVRQFYRIENGQVFILSLSCKKNMLAKYFQDLWRILESVAIVARTMDSPAGEAGHPLGQGTDGGETSDRPAVRSTPAPGEKGTAPAPGGSGLDQGSGADDLPEIEGSEESLDPEAGTSDPAKNHQPNEVDGKPKNK